MACACRARHITRLQPRLDVFGQHLAQLHTPLVKAVDAPDGTADKHAVFVQRHQRAQAGRIQLLQHQECAGPVAGEMFVPTGIGLAQQQRLGLGQRVGQQLLMVARQRVRGVAYGNKVDRNHVRALVQQLEERMLAVGAGLTPHHG